jgi:hypothetical protein
MKGRLEWPPFFINTDCEKTAGNCCRYKLFNIYKLNTLLIIAIEINWPDKINSG